MKIQYFILIFFIPPLVKMLSYYLSSNRVGEGEIADIPNSSEDGYLSRFPGGIIEYFREEENVHRLVTSRPLRHKKDNSTLFDIKEIIGLRKTILYQVPVQHDSEFICNFYKKQLEDSNFDIIYSDHSTDLGDPAEWYKKVFMTKKNIFAWKDLSEMMQGKPFCYFSAVRKDGEKEIYISIFAVNHFRNNKSTGVFLFVSE